MLRGFKKQHKESISHKESQNSISIGMRAEDSVASFVERKGMRVLARNVSYSWGEIDIVAQEGDVIVCIEVKSQQGVQDGFMPEHHFDYRKAQQVKKVFEAYVREHDLMDKQQRIDLAAVILQGDATAIRYYKNALE